MKITLLLIGKTTEAYLDQGIQLYTERLKHYISFQTQIIPDLKNSKNLSIDQQKQKEGELILKEISNTDYVVLLDERGKHFSSIEFSAFLQKSMNQSVSRMVLVVGGPYGVHEDVKKRASQTLSFSNMTFSHQMIRLFVTEQLYRAFTILKNEPYHHE